MPESVDRGQRASVPDSAAAHEGADLERLRERLWSLIDDATDNHQMRRGRYVIHADDVRKLLARGGTNG